MVVIGILLRRIRQESDGFGLLEATIALGLLGIIAVCFLVAMTTAYKASVLADEQVTAKSLARTQMEYVDQQPYDVELDANLEASYSKLDSADILEGYSILSVNRSGAVVDDIVGVPWDTSDPLNPQPAGSDESLQKITLIIKYNGAESFSMEGFKVKR
ncbi:hypothetical protein ACFLV5_02400 [Chloroflexota bacterium]